jgi:hypothetical protein
MANLHNPNVPATASDVERMAASLSELLLDLLRSVRSAVPIALSEVLGADIDTGRRVRVAEVIFREVAARYRVAASATLLATGGAGSDPCRSF